MDKKAMMVFAPGFEEVEALTAVDLLRRAGVSVAMVSLNGEREVTGARDITVKMDGVFSDVDTEDIDAVLLPGGMPGTNYLRKSNELKSFLVKMNQHKKWIGAICAAPTVLHDAGIVAKKNVTSYPGFEGEFTDATYQTESVVVDGNIITSRGVGTAIDFALALICVLVSDEKAKEIAESIVYKKQ